MNGAKIGKNIILCKGHLVCGIKQELIHLFSVIIYKFLLITIWGIFIFPYFINSDVLYFSITSKNFILETFSLRTFLFFLIIPDI